MAKIIDGSVCIMHDVKENVKVAYQAMKAAGSNVNYVEE